MDGRDDASFWSDEPPKLSERELLEWCAGISDRAAAKLRRLQLAEAEAEAKSRHDRELLEFVAAISGKPEHERELRALLKKEAEERATQKQRRPTNAESAQEVWDSSKHPRGGFSQNRGWWSPAAGAGSAAPADGGNPATSNSAAWRSALTTNKLAAPTGSDALRRGFAGNVSCSGKRHSRRRKSRCLVNGLVCTQRQQRHVARQKG